VREGRESVMTEDDTIGHDQRERSRCEGCCAATPQIGALLRSSGERRYLRGEFRFALGGCQLQCLACAVFPKDRTSKVSRIQGVDAMRMRTREPDLTIPPLSRVVGEFERVCTTSFAILRVVRMRVLFSISILALIALLWASIAIARHIHQARLRRHRELHHRATESEVAMETEASTETKDLP
jgi:hypothetical protein